MKRYKRIVKWENYDNFFRINNSGFIVGVIPIVGWLITLIIVCFVTPISYLFHGREVYFEEIKVKK